MTNTRSPEWEIGLDQIQDQVAALRLLLVARNLGIARGPSEVDERILECLTEMLDQIDRISDLITPATPAVLH